MQWRPLLLGLAIAGLLVGGTWALASSPGPRLAEDPPPADGPDPAEPAATTPAPQPPATPLEPAPTGTAPIEAPGTEPQETATPSPVAPPTPSPATSPVDARPLVGAAELTDATGDLLDSAGQPPPQEEPAADLVAVRLEGDGTELVVTWSLAGDVPASAGSLVWSLDVWSGGTQLYTATVQQVGARRVAGVLDWDSGQQHVPPDPLVEGDTVTLRVPAALLERVDGPFQWQALGQLDGGYEDYVPADGTLTWFPSEDG